MDQIKSSELDRLYSDMERLVRASRRHPDRASELRRTGEDFYTKRGIIPAVVGRYSLFTPVENHASPQDLEHLKGLAAYTLDHVEEGEDAFWTNFIVLAESSLNAGTCKESVLDMVEYAHEIRK